jgi:predicted DNA-binding transcriptional regulator AlpA
MEAAAAVAAPKRKRRKLVEPQYSDRLLRPSQAMQKLGISKSSLYRLIGDGLLKRPRRIGGLSASGWLESELDEFLGRCVESAPRPKRRAALAEPAPTA